MKKVFLITILLLSLSSAFSQAVFQKAYGGIHADFSQWVAQTSDGGYIIAGYTNSYGAGRSDYYLVKTNSIGDTLWTRVYGTVFEERLASACATSDGGYFLCGTSLDTAGNTDVYLVKTDGNGALLWSFRYDDGGQEEGSSVLATSSGDYLIAGTEVTSSFQPAFCVLRVSQAGNLVWSKRYSVGGSFWLGHAKLIAVQGGFILAGDDHVPSGNKVCLVQTDTSGNVNWCKIFGGTADESISDIIQSQNGDFFLLAEEGNGAYRIDLLNITSTGVLNWTKDYATADTLNMTSKIRQGSDGALRIAGSCSNYYSGTGALFFTVDTAGLLLSAQTYGSDYAAFSSLDFTSDNGCVLAGDIPNVHSPADSSSFYLVKTDAAGNSGCLQNAVSITVSSLAFTTATTSVSVFTGSTLQPVSTTGNTGCIPLDACTVGIHENSASADASIFPNPFTENATVEIPASNGESKFELFDCYGKCVRQFSFTGNKTELQRNDLPAGIYFYRITQDHSLVASGKLLAE